MRGEIHATAGFHAMLVNGRSMDHFRCRVIKLTDAFSGIEASPTWVIEVPEFKSEVRFEVRGRPGLGRVRGYGCSPEPQSSVRRAREETQSLLSHQ